MYNDTIKLLNLEQFKLKIKNEADITEIRDVIIFVLL